MGTTMSDEAVEARRNYQREYRRKNQAKINAKRREWRADNKDRVQQYNRQYWERVAEGKIIPRASWLDYDISKERLSELRDIVRSGKYDAVVLSAAYKANESAAGHIILSVKKNLSYEHVEFNERLGRCALGRSNFYGARRLFFHYLDIEFKNIQAEV